MYFQLAFAMDRVKALAQKRPEWKDQEPFKSAIAGDLAKALAGSTSALMQLMGATHGNTTSDEFDGIVRDWLATAKHPTTGRLYTEMAYQPMIELLAYLRANGFKTFIASGGGVDFMRGFAERVYGIPPEQIIGSTGEVKFEFRDGKPVLLRLPALNTSTTRKASRSRSTARSAPADRRVRQFRRRPADAAVDMRRQRHALLHVRSSHRRRA